MKKVITFILVLFISVLTLWGIHAAAANTHTILGDCGYIPFIQEIFQ